MGGGGGGDIGNLLHRPVFSESWFKFKLAVVKKEKKKSGCLRKRGADYAGGLRKKKKGDINFAGRRGGMECGEN